MLLKPGFFMEAHHLSAPAFWPEISPCVMGCSFTLLHPLDPREASYTHPLHPVPLSALEAVASPGDTDAPPAPGQGRPRQELRNGLAVSGASTLAGHDCSTPPAVSPETWGP